jgi:hypothetical protein
MFGVGKQKTKNTSKTASFFLWRGRAKRKAKGRAEGRVEGRQEEYICCALLHKFLIVRRKFECSIDIHDFISMGERTRASNHFGTATSQSTHERRKATTFPPRIILRLRVMLFIGIVSSTPKKNNT